jgi:hypothetical protein
MSLNDRKQRFVDAFLIRPHATLAAIKAGYSAKTARTIGSKLKTEPDVKAAIEAGRAELRAKNLVTREWLVERARRIAHTDMRDVGVWGKGYLELFESEDLTDEASTSICELNTEFAPEEHTIETSYFKDGSVSKVVEKKKGPAARVKAKLSNKMEAIKWLHEVHGFSNVPDEDPKAKAQELRELLRAMEATVGGENDSTDTEMGAT